jgi:hypothetical protein
LCDEQQFGNKRSLKTWKEDYNLFAVAGKSYFIDGTGIIVRGRSVRQTVLRRTERGGAMEFV